MEQIPAEMWPQIIKALGPSGGVAVVAYLAVKGGLNGVKADVKAIRECLTKIQENMGVHAADIKIHGARQDAIEKRVEKLEP